MTFFKNGDVELAATVLKKKLAFFGISFKRWAIGFLYLKKR
jgi:hypothetical protein